MQQNPTSCIRNVGENPTCPFCSNRSIKYGSSKKGSQRFRCKSCCRSFLLDYSYLACKAGTDTSIKEHVKESCGIRSIARLLKISATTVLKRIVSIAQKIEKPFMVMGKDYELDELCTFVKSKANLRWVVYAIRRDTSEVVDFTVGCRSGSTLRRVTDTLVLSCARRVFTDKLPQYSTLLPPCIHHTRQYGTNHIERKNLSLRTHLKRLSRRTICFSRSQRLLSACLAIYFWD